MKKQIITFLLISSLIFSFIVYEKIVATTGDQYRVSTNILHETPINITVSKNDKSLLDSLMWQIVFDLHAAEEAIDSGNPKSQLAFLNRKGNIRDFSPYIYNNLHYAQKWFEASVGAFDVTVAPLTDLWLGAIQKGRMPGQEEIARTHEKVGFQNIWFDKDANTIGFKTEGSSISLNDIATEYSMNVLANNLQKSDISQGSVTNKDGIVKWGTEPFNYEIFVFDGTNREQIGTLNLSVRSAVTKHKFERSFIAGEKKHPFIIDPRTGLPVDNELISVTVAGSDITDESACASALLIMGSEKGKEMLSKFEDISAIFITQTPEGETRVLVPEKLKEHFRVADKWLSNVEYY